MSLKVTHPAIEKNKKNWKRFQAAQNASKQGMIQRAGKKGKAERTLRLIRKLTLPYLVSFIFSSFLCLESSIRH